VRLILDRSAGQIVGKKLKNQTKQIFILNFRPLRTCFEKEATSTPSVIHLWKALVKPEFGPRITEYEHEYLNLTTRSTEILVLKQTYRIRKAAIFAVRFRPRYI